MPQIYTHECSTCTFALATGWGGGMYVEDASGNRVRCGHPGEYSAVADVLGLPYDEVKNALLIHDTTPRWWWLPSRREARGKAFSNLVQLVKSRTGMARDCVCVSCLSQFRLDLDKDERACPDCGAVEVFTVTEMIGRPCPSCKNGVITCIDTGIIS